MKPTVQAIYFSPTRSTAKIVKTVASSISKDIKFHDITREPLPSLSLKKNEIAVIGVPSYSGRVPFIAKQRLANLIGNGMPVVLVCVYGNRAFDDTLLELHNICSDKNLTTISAGAFIAKHAIFSEIAKSRPDTMDIEKAQYFGKQSLERLSTGQEKQICLPGNFPYRDYGKSPFPFQIQVNDNCNDCGKCIDLCPVEAINKNDSSIIDPNLCIACGRCIRVCRQNARSFGGDKFPMASLGFAEKNSARKEIELFYSEPI